jgi:ATP-dependent DNA helicase PIF1
MRQKQALAIMTSGVNVFLTGAPGAGKTYVLNQFVGRAMRAGKRVAVTASTGIAATHLGGTTIHSWSGLGIRDALSSDDLQWLKGNDRLVKRYNSTDILVIDEVSMLHGARLDMVNQAAKLLRQNEAPFGGLQVILVGDLYQLPPINRNGEAVDFVHTSATWAELNPSICYITEQHRQSGHDGLLDLLEAMRAGTLSDEHRYIVGERMGKQPAEDAIVTRLYSHNLDVDAINQRHLNAIEYIGKTFRMTTKGGKARLEQLIKSVLAPEELVLKVGAEVMFVANNFAEGFVNGSRGQVVAFQGSTPVVALATGRTIYVEPHSWTLSEDGKVRAEVEQLPLRLAWAITIHKSQGMSLDAAEIDLSRAFTPGMGYVALSRVRTLDGLYLKGVNRMAFTMHPEIHNLDASLRRASGELAITTEDIADEAVPSASSSAPLPTAAIDQALLTKLKKWRAERAETASVPAYVVAHNKALEAIAAAPPTTENQLLALPGFGSKKVESYGMDILALVAKHLAG